MTPVIRSCDLAHRVRKPLQQLIFRGLPQRPAQQQVPLQVEQAAPHRGGGFPQVVLSDQGHASGQVEMITPRDRHGHLMATLQFGEGAGPTPRRAEQGLRY